MKDPNKLFAEANVTNGRIIFLEVKAQEAEAEEGEIAESLNILNDAQTILENAPAKHLFQPLMDQYFSSRSELERALNSSKSKTADIAKKMTDEKTNLVNLQAELAEQGITINLHPKTERPPRTTVF